RSFTSSPRAMRALRSSPEASTESAATRYERTRKLFSPLISRMSPISRRHPAIVRLSIPSIIDRLLREVAAARAYGALALLELHRNLVPARTVGSGRLVREKVAVLDLVQDLAKGIVERRSEAADPLAA